jgi:hypothetical protein
MKTTIVLMALLSAAPALAQSQDQCQQVRQAVAQYGYRQAKAHAVAQGYSAQQIASAESCLRVSQVRRRR